MPKIVETKRMFSPIIQSNDQKVRAIAPRGITMKARRRLRIVWIAAPSLSCANELCRKTKATIPKSRK